MVWILFVVLHAFVPIWNLIFRSEKVWVMWQPTLKNIMQLESIIRYQEMDFVMPCQMHQEHSKEMKQLKSLSIRYQTTIELYLVICVLLNEYIEQYQWSYPMKNMRFSNIELVLEIYCKTLTCQCVGVCGSMEQLFPTKFKVTSN